MQVQSENLPPIGISELIAPEPVTRYENEPHVRLMLKFRAGDCDALAELFQEYELPLMKFFISRLGDRQSAEDAVQDVFVRVIRFGINYSPVARFSTWLFTIATNIARDRRREQNRLHQAMPVQSDSNLCDLSARQTDSHQVDWKDEFAMVFDQIDMLPNRQVKAMLMYYLDEKSYDEIALEIGGTPLAVKGLLARGRRSLRSRLVS